MTHVRNVQALREGMQAIQAQLTLLEAIRPAAWLGSGS